MTVSNPGTPRDSAWRLTVDLWSATVLVWLASAGRRVSLTPSAHLFFFDRYRRLASLHAAHGRVARAARLHAKADAHYRAAGGDEGPPYAAAMAMPRPRRLVMTNAMGTRRSEGSEPPDDAA
jgi:hypothetical protein